MWWRNAILWVKSLASLKQIILACPPCLCNGNDLIFDLENIFGLRRGSWTQAWLGLAMDHRLLCAAPLTGLKSRCRLRWHQGIGGQCIFSLAGCATWPSKVWKIIFQLNTRGYCAYTWLTNIQNQKSEKWFLLDIFDNF